MNGRTLRRLRDPRGQSLVEMALALPILLAVLIGIVELGRAWNARQVIVNAAREATRVAVLPSKGQADAQAVVDSYLNDANLDPGLASVAIVGADGTTGDPTSVQIDYPYAFQFMGPVVDLLGGGGAIPGSITLSTIATMRHE